MNPARRLALLLLFAFAVGCGAGQRERTLHAALVTVDVASVAFVEVNKAQLDKAVAGSTSYEDGIHRIEAWEKRSDPVLNGIRIAYRLIAAAALDTDSSLDEVMSTVLGLAADVQKLRGEP